MDILEKVAKVAPPHYKFLMPVAFFRAVFLMKNRKFLMLPSYPFSNAFSNGRYRHCDRWT